MVTEQHPAALDDDPATRMTLRVYTVQADGARVRERPPVAVPDGQPDSAFNPVAWPPCACPRCRSRQAAPVSRPGGRWLDTGTRAGAMVPVAVAAAEGRVQGAYRAYLDHAQGCADCEALQGRCEAAEGLWVAYREARS